MVLGEGKRRFVAKLLRKKSISEYLVDMWQVEDIIRAFGCSLPAIEKNYISKFDYTDEQKEEETDWYGNLVRMMNAEGKREQGHLQINQVVMDDLVDLHKRLLDSNRYPFYSAEYYKVLPFIVEIRSKNKRAESKIKEEGSTEAPLIEANENESEIETCFDVLYGIMLLRLQKKPITPETEHAVKEITTFIGMLSDYYQQDKEGKLKFDD